MLIIIFRNKLNIKEAIDYIAERWNNVTQKTIKNCQIKTGILSTYDDDEIENLLNHLPESDNIIEYFQILNQKFQLKKTLLMKKLLIQHKLIKKIKKQMMMIMMMMMKYL